MVKITMKENKMKLTKKQIRRIIKENKANLLKEMRRPMTTEADELEFAMDEYIKARVRRGEDDPSLLHREIVAILDELLGDSMLDSRIDISRY